MSKGKNNSNPIAVIILCVGVFILLLLAQNKPKTEETSKSSYDTAKEYSVGETVYCPNFEITVDKFQIKKKGTAIDSYQVISDPEWIGVTLSIKNKSDKEHTFYNSDVTLLNSNGEKLDASFVSYKVWKVEPLHSPTLTPGGTKTGYIQFSNTNTDNENLKLKISCNDKLINDDTEYTYILK